MQQPAIRYDLLVQDALRAMVRDLLIKVAREGLPGEHHFFVTFKTHAPGVQLSPRMRAQYPDEITIVLQHQFWDLIVNERQFEVGLSFSNIPERLVVPFSALTGFHDPSVPFMLKFEPKEEAAAEAHARTGPTALPRVAPRQDQDAKAPAPAAKPAARRSTEIPAPSPEAEADAGGAEEGTKVVSIDAFRKKT
ncbi:MAG: stringent starvation family protein [Hyphomicrobiales bacterium]|nr:stringent starvation family protein [Hyphomicrobiales bacterium]